MKKRLICLLICMFGLTGTAFAEYSEAAGRLEKVLQQLPTAENAELLTGEAIFVMLDGDILKALEEKGKPEVAATLKAAADAALKLAAYDDVEKARTNTMAFCKELERAIAVLEGNAPGLSFVDVSAGAWYYDAVEYTVGQGIFAGMDATHFAPDTAITRGMFLALMGRMYPALGTSEEQFYTDVAADMYYAPAINAAKAAGILDFVAGEQFSPDQPITREELVTVLRGCMGKSGIDITYKTDASFADGGVVSAWAKDAVSWAAEQKVVSGFEDGTFRPQATATRAQVAQIFYNLSDCNAIAM